LTGVASRPELSAATIANRWSQIHSSIASDWTSPGLPDRPLPLGRWSIGRPRKNGTQPSRISRMSPGRSRTPASAAAASSSSGVNIRLVRRSIGSPIFSK
jgi:hypothetical protein